MKSFLLPERWKREAFFIYATTDQSPLLRKILFPIVPLLLGVPTTQQQGTFRKQCLWDSGKVPLGLQATARDEKKMMQLASLRQQTLRVLTTVSALNAHRLRPEIEPDGSSGIADATCSFAIPHLMWEQACPPCLTRGCRSTVG